jgi:branched-chain amino acid transport system ATP-binding protein
MLQLSNLSAGYEPVKVVKNISLEVGQKEIVCIVGSNGAGKTTTLKSIVGLADVFEGKVSLDGVDITSKRTEQIAQLGVILVPDDRRLFPSLTCEENLELGAYLEKARMYYQESLDLVYSIFPALKDRRKQLAKTLSGGEQQMLAVARGIMARPSLLLIDEPSTGLSPKLVSTLLKSLRALSENGVSILFTEQNAYAALEYSDRAYVLARGLIALTGSSEAILNSRDLISQYFGGIHYVNSDS